MEEFSKEDEIAYDIGLQAYVLRSQPHNHLSYDQVAAVLGEEAADKLRGPRKNGTGHPPRATILIQATDFGDVAGSVVQWHYA